MTRSLFGTIITKPKRRYIGKYKKDGHEYYTPTFATKSAVRHHLDEIRADIIKGTWTPPTPKNKRIKDYGDPTITEFTPIIIEYLENMGRSPNTIRSYESRWRANIAGRLPTTMHISEINTDTIDDLYRDLRRTLAPKTVHSAMLTLSACLRIAKHLKIIPTTPEMPHGVFSKAGGKQHNTITYTYTEIFTLAKHAKPEYAAAIILAGIGALRSSEIAALTRADISKDGTQVSVSKAVKRDRNGKSVLGEPKSEASRRTISLDEASAKWIRTHLTTHVDSSPEALLFAPSGRGKARFVTDRVLRGMLEQACIDAGLPRGWFHDLRHSALTMYGQAGATIADLMARAGHSDPDTVLIYQHSNAKRDAELTARLAQLS